MAKLTADEVTEVYVGKDLIWRDATGTYSYALKDIAVLVCRYGGTIGVVEVNKGAEGTNKPIITLAQMQQVERSNAKGNVVEAWRFSKLRDILTWSTTTYIPTYTANRSIEQKTWML